MVQNKPINYKLFEKNPNKFYESIIDEERLIVKCHVKRKKKADGSDDVVIVEKLQKRHIGARLDEVMAAITAANLKKAESAPK